MILPVSPDRPIGIVKCHEAGKAPQCTEPGLPHPRVQGRIGNARTSNRLRRNLDLPLDRRRQIQIPPLRQIDRPNDHANPPARLHHAMQLPQRQVGVAFLQHRYGKRRIERCIRKRQRFRICLLKGYRQAIGQQSRLLQQETVQIGGDDPAAVQSRGQQPIQRPRTAADVQDHVALPDRHRIPQRANQRPITLPRRSVLQRRYAAQVPSAQHDHGEPPCEVLQRRFPLRGGEEERQQNQGWSFALNRVGNAGNRTSRPG
ncbi:MAG TPA: hypothetical protein DDZ81_23250 [Acetobacteraceae bacterium]|nr:hypothetical protein [Acetobacteraceae bacterium]